MAFTVYTLNVEAAENVAIDTTNLNITYIGSTTSIFAKVD